MQHIENKHNDIAHKGHRANERRAYAFYREAAAVLYGGRHAEGAAEAHHGVARVKKAGGYHRSGAKEALHKGQGEVAYIVA